MNKSTRRTTPTKPVGTKNYLQRWKYREDERIMRRESDTTKGGHQRKRREEQEREREREKERERERWY